MGAKKVDVVALFFLITCEIRRLGRIRTVDSAKKVAPFGSGIQSIRVASCIIMKKGRAIL